MTAFTIVIPARYGSTRLTAKPLQIIADKTMLQHTYERACQSNAERVIIATDDERIQQSVMQYTDQVMMTSPKLRNGTERMAAVAMELQQQYQCQDDEIFVNVQGDEPLINPKHINQVAYALATDPQAGISTLCYPIEDIAELSNPNIVKVVRNKHNHALYFSRAPIPWDREHFSLLSIHSNHQLELSLLSHQLLRHIGLYAYRFNSLKQFIQLPPSPIEVMESLEQLRALYYGIAIKVVQAEEIPHAGVDVHDDLQRIEGLLLNP